MQPRNLTDEELLRHVDNMPDADELLRELAQRLVAKSYMQAAVDTLDNIGIDYTETADLERLENALAFDKQHDCAVAEKLIDACAEADVHDADDFKRMTAAVDDLNAKITNLSNTIDDLREQLAQAIA